jgi:hypothetical protein
MFPIICQKKVVSLLRIIKYGFVLVGRTGSLRPHIYKMKILYK